MINLNTKTKTVRIVALVVCMLLITGIMSYANAAELRVNPTGTVKNSGVYLNGKMIVCSAYNINGNNYFKLRDIMQELDIYVGYDNATKTIDVDTARAYVPDGSETTAQIEKNRAEGFATEFFPAIAITFTTSVRLNGQPVDWAAYNIYGNNHFKLRDIGEALDISVEYDENTRNVEIDTLRGYGETAKPKEPDSPILPESPTAEEIEAMKMEIIRLTNVERVNAGLNEVQVLPALMECAQAKADDMVINNYLGHISPVYGAPVDMISSYIKNAKNQRENIAVMGYPLEFLPQSTINIWMGSAGHKAAILDPKNTHIGIGISLMVTKETKIDGTDYYSASFRIAQQFAMIK